MTLYSISMNFATHLMEPHPSVTPTEDHCSRQFISIACVSSSLINVMFISCVELRIRIKWTTWGLVWEQQSLSLSAHIFRSSLLSQNAALIWRGSRLGFGKGQSLRHALDRDSFAAHFDMDEERGRGQTGAVCLQQMNMSIPWEERWSTLQACWHKAGSGNGHSEVYLSTCP